MYLSVIIPAYNEEKRLSKTLTEVDRYLGQQTYEYEIIVVSDGSKDKTAEVVRELQPKIKNLKLIDNKENHGKGYVVRQGMLEAKGEVRLFTDADNSTSIDQVEKMLPYFSTSAEGYGGSVEAPLARSEGGKEWYDIVIGSRDVKGAKILNPQPWYRRILGKGFNLMVQIIVGLFGVWDTQCGFKVLSAKAVNNILPRCKINRWAFDPEILIIGGKLGYKIKEVPIVWVNDLESKVKLKSVFKMALDLLEIRWNLISGKYFKK